jgi:predicted GNAT family acetyltransferase
MTANEYNFYPVRNILKRRNFKIENAMAVIYSLTFKGVLFQQYQDIQQPNRNKQTIKIHCVHVPD